MRRVCTKVRSYGCNFHAWIRATKVRILMPPYGRDGR